MKKRIVLFIFTSIMSCVAGASAATRADASLETNTRKGNWFVSGVYGLGLAESPSDLYTAPDGTSQWVGGGILPFSKFGIMGGYLGKWGGYTKVGFDENFWTPHVTLGVTKRLYSWYNRHPNTLHLSMGFGGGPVCKVSKIKYIDQGTLPSTTIQLLQRNMYGDGTGGIVEGGAILNLGHLNLGLSYSLTFQISIEEPGPKPNHTISISAGYTF